MSDSFKLFSKIAGAVSAAAVFVVIGINWNAAANEREDTRGLVDDTAANLKVLSETVQGLAYRHKVEEAIEADRKARKREAAAERAEEEDIDEE